MLELLNDKSKVNAAMSKEAAVRGQDFGNQMIMLKNALADVAAQFGADIAPGTVLYFPALQTCADGTADWTDTSGTKGADHPAPKLTVTGPEGSAGAAPCARCVHRRADPGPGQACRR